MDDFQDNDSHGGAKRMTDPLQLCRKLKALIDTVPTHLIWHTIRDHQNNVLAPAWRDESSCPPRDLPEVDFRGKSVVDLGCNFGHYTFLAARRGARDVLGCEMDETIVEACTLLRDLHRVPNVRFTAADFTTDDIGGPFDLVLMTDIIGQHKVRKGRVGPLLDAMARQGRNELVTSVRAEYDIPNVLRSKTEDVAAHYPDHVRGDTLNLLDFIADYLSEEWSMDIMEAETPAIPAGKTMVRFTKK